MQTSTLSLSTLTGSTIRASFLTLSTLTVSSINGALPGTGTGAFSMLAVSSLQTASTIITSSINVTTGNVGIGITNPTAQVHATGTTLFSNIDIHKQADVSVRRSMNTSFAIVAGGENYNSILYLGTPFYSGATAGAYKCAIIAAGSGSGWGWSTNDLHFCINNSTGQTPTDTNTSAFTATTADSRMVIKTSGNVGIGTINPTALLHIKTTSAAMRITGNLTNTSTRPALSTTPGAYEIRGSGSGGDTPDDGFLRLSAGGGTATAVQSYIDLSGYSQTADMNSNIVFGASGAERMRVTSTGLNVVGAIYATGNITAFSDQRYKQNIVRLDHSLDAIRSLSGYYYTREDYLPGERHIGLLAQEVKEVLPEAVHYDSTNDKYSVNYNCLIAPVVEAIKELYDRSEAQAKTIEAQAKIIQAQQLIIQKVTERLDLH